MSISLIHNTHKLDLDRAADCMFAGNFMFTVRVARQKGEDFKLTFKVQVKREDADLSYDAYRAKLFFVRVLNGSSFDYFGLIRQGNIAITANSCVSHNSVEHRCFKYVLDCITGSKIEELRADCLEKFAAVEFWHEGRCAKCATPLNDPISISLGLGPKCGKTQHAALKKLFKNKMIA